MDDNTKLVERLRAYKHPTYDPILQAFTPVLTDNTALREAANALEALQARVAELEGDLGKIANGEVSASIWPDLAVRYEMFARAALKEPSNGG